MRIAAIILAAGFSRRFGPTNKLLETVGDKPALAHVLDRVASAPFYDRFVVVNPGGENLAALCDPHRFVIVENRRADAGIGRSIAAGVERADTADAVVIALGDMPLVGRKTYSSILTAFSDNPEYLIVAPEYEGRRGHPVLFARPLFNALKTLDSDTGAKGVIEQHKDSLLTVPVKDKGIHLDFDRREDLGRF